MMDSRFLYIILHMQFTWTCGHYVFPVFSGWLIGLLKEKVTWGIKPFCNTLEFVLWLFVLFLGYLCLETSALNNQLHLPQWLSGYGVLLLSTRLWVRFLATAIVLYWWGHVKELQDIKINVETSTKASLVAFVLF